MTTTLRELVAAAGLPVAVQHAVARVADGPATTTQRQGVPAALEHPAVFLQAPTGTGKTLVAAIAAANVVQHGASAPHRPRVIALCPTRELATQVGQVLEQVLDGLGRRCVVLTGPPAPRRDTLLFSSPVDCLVTTPGRMLDLMHRHLADLSAVSLVVLDEADFLLDTNFIAQTTEILHATPLSDKKTRLLALSATANSQLHRHLEAASQAPLHTVRIDRPAPPSPSPAATPATTGSPRQLTVFSSPSAQTRRTALHDALSRVHSAMVFVPRRNEVAPLVDFLTQRGLRVAGLSGNSAPSTRRTALTDLAGGAISAVVCTDIAARGIDIPRLELVVHTGVPHSAEDLLHRSGRTGRGTAQTGAVIVMCAPEELPRIEDLAQRVGMEVHAPVSAQAISEMLGAVVNKNTPHTPRNPTRATQTTARQKSSPRSSSGSPRSQRRQHKRRGGPPKRGQSRGTHSQR